MAGAPRSLEYALLASVALHVAALFGISMTHEKSRQSDAVPQPIEARLAEAEPVLISIPRKSVSKKGISKKSISGSVAASIPAPAAEAVAESRSMPAAAPIPAAPPSAAATPPVDATTVAQYRSQLVDAAQRYKSYPDAARVNNWTGNVLVGVAVGADGMPHASLRKSSGRPVLDERALEMFQQAAKAVPVPPALRGREFSLEVRAIYGLED